MYKSLWSAVFFLLLCIAVCAYAEDVGASKAPSESSIILQQDEASVKVGGADTPQSKDTSTVSVLVRLVLSLAAVCVLIYGVLYFIRRSKRFTAADDPFLKNVASLAIAPNKTVCVITLIDKAYVIGVSENSLSLIAEVNDTELIDAMNLHAAQVAGPKENFSSFLHTFFPASKPKDAEANLFDSFLAQQRSRLKNSGGVPRPDEGAEVRDDKGRGEHV